MTLLNDNERIDDLLYNGLKLIQDKTAFCFGCDAVELANFLPKVKSGTTVCDLGAGNGIIGVLLAAKKGYQVTAVEIQAPAAELCRRNAELNGLSEKIKIENVPMQEMLKLYPKGSFDAVVANPPYQKTETGRMSEGGAVAIARHEIKVTLKEVVETAAHLVKFGGKFYMVYPASRLSEAITECSNSKLEPKVLQLFVPSRLKPPHLFILECISGGKSGLKIPPIKQINSNGV